MSSKLDQSLDEITGSRRNDARRARRGGKPRVSTGGITKNTAPAKANKGQAKAAAVAAAAPALPLTGESKVLISNMPSDVTEQMIKEFMSTTVGPVKKILLNYNKNGRSVGVATVIFSKPQSAAEAAKKHDGTPIDGRPMKVEVILGAKYAPVPAQPKSLGERISQPKREAAKPKSAAPKPANAAAGGAAKSDRGKGRAGRGGRGGRAAGRPKPKSVEELDAEMSEYFEPVPTNGQAAAAGNGNGAPAAAAPAAGPDAMLEDDIM